MLFQSVLFFSLLLSVPDAPQEYELYYYPKKLHPGDTFYVILTYDNQSDQEKQLPNHTLYLPLRFIKVEGKEWILPFVYDNKFSFTCVPDNTPPTICPPNSKTIIYAGSFTVPPLEDFYESEFWTNINTNLSDSNGYPINFTLEFNTEYIHSGIAPRKILNGQISLQQRPKNEMVLIRQWYDNTPREYFPVFRERSGTPTTKYTPQDYNRQKILNYDFKYFIPAGNRYPGDPNAPETWQGWKELEDSLSSSTMKDEIRLTRIIIQYCDTKDQKVLDELRKWFVDMNVIQRICMAKSIFGRLCICAIFWSPDRDDVKDLIPPYRDLYKTVHEYDITAKSEQEIERLKQLELLE